MTSCTAFASGKKTAEIDVDTQDSEQSSIGEITIIGELEGDFVAVDEGHDSSTIVGVGYNVTIEIHSVYSKILLDVFKQRCNR